MNTAPEIGTAALDFSATGIEGKTITLAQYRGEKGVLLVLNRGFK
ncbi:MAG: hypothetical protein WCS16_08075 [Desulfuromonas sp.]